MGKQSTPVSRQHNYTQLRAFHMVARLRGFTRAAAGLGLTQPAVTVQVKALETAYGVRLFERQGREVVLTDTGRRLFDLTQEIFAAEERAGEFLAGRAGLQSGSLTLAADGPHAALDVVSLFRRKHPQIQLFVRLGNTDLAVQDLLEQRADAAVIGMRRPIPRTFALPLQRRNLLALVPRAHALASRRRLRWSDLRGQVLILREQGSTTRRVIDEALRRQGLDLTPGLELGSREAVREAVARGLGIGFLFEREADGDSRSIAVPLTGVEAASTDYVVCLSSQRQRAVVAALLAVAAELSGKPR
jgi:aminoethylphosphonate catabolism LysR family transcriptional regulator